MAQPTWNTPAGSLGSFPSLVNAEIVISASAILPAVSVTYTLLSGSLPLGMTFNDEGVISGIPSLVTQETISSFAIRATDNYGNIRDRTFSITVTGNAIPAFITPPGTILTTYDSIWVSLPIQYSNPDSTNTVGVSLAEGVLPPGLEINENGLIRGYPTAPFINITVPSVETAATVTETTNVITCLSTTGFSLGRPVTFSGTSMFGGIEEDTTYYIKSIINSTSFTISTTPNGYTLSLTSGTGFMSVVLPAISVGQPTIKTYNFSLRLDSPLGGDLSSYSITVVNQNTPVSQGGPGLPVNNRTPVIFNTQPETFNIGSNEYYGYYVLPPVSSGYNTYPNNVPAFIGKVQSDNYFAFKIIGYDFDNNEIAYVYTGLPAGLVGDPNTGWITGTPYISSAGINQFSFSVAVYKKENPTRQSPFITFSYNLINEVTGDITWITSDNLGTIFNGTISTKSVLAESDVSLLYRITSGSLPPNLTLLSNGEITGYVANQPTADLLGKNVETDFNFTIEAYSPDYPIVKSQKTFTLTVFQKYTQPTDILYIKASPSIVDRNLVNSLLSSESLIPYDYLYRPTDIYFGKATDVVYEHAYGIYASDLEEYLAAVTKNHYWRNITLGELKTAQAKNSNGEVIYEVVYSQVIDNLQNPEGISVSQDIYWPRPIDLGLGPWYTSVTNIFTSYDTVLGQSYYTSLSPGYTRSLYPNSLYNMRNRVGQVLGQEYDSTLLPLWMTSQQENGSTLGYTQAWVICYVKPRIVVENQSLTYQEFTNTGLNRNNYLSYAEIIKNNINTLWLDPVGIPYKLNQINFRIDRFSVDKSITYNYDKNTSPPAWTGLPSATPVPDPLDSQNFYVLFPRQTILPDRSQ